MIAMHVNYGTSYKCSNQSCQLKGETLQVRSIDVSNNSIDVVPLLEFLHSPSPFLFRINQ